MEDHSWDKGAGGDEVSRGDEEFEARNLSPTFSAVSHTVFLCVSGSHTSPRMAVFCEFFCYSLGMGALGCAVDSLIQRQPQPGPGP